MWHVIWSKSIWFWMFATHKVQSMSKVQKFNISVSACSKNQARIALSDTDWVTDWLNNHGKSSHKADSFHNVWPDWFIAWEIKSRKGLSFQVLNHLRSHKLRLTMDNIFGGAVQWPLPICYSTRTWLWLWAGIVVHLPAVRPILV